MYSLEIPYFYIESTEARPVVGLQQLENIDSVKPCFIRRIIFVGGRSDLIRIPSFFCYKSSFAYRVEYYASSYDQVSRIFLASTKCIWELLYHSAAAHTCHD